MDPIDKLSILSDSRKDDYVQNPDKYAGHTWYGSSLMLRGDVVDP